jgi:hypothetical protein
MSYIGNTNTAQAFTPAVDFFNGNGSTVAFTLSRPVASVAQVQAVISNVPQNPGSAFTVSNNTITFTSAPPSGTQNIYVYYTSPITQVIAPSDGTVGTSALATGAVTTAKLSSSTGTGAVALASLPSFTGTIGVGGASASSSGAGITFPSTDLHYSSNANTLDDYEEGTFTPTLTGSTGTPTVTYTTRTGVYVKIGSFVYVSIYLQTTAVSGGSGDIRVTGLPFATGTTDTMRGNVITYLVNVGGIAVPTSIASGNTFFAILGSGNTGGGWGLIALSTVPAAGTGAINILLTYQTT